jgi:hypothetical protein
MSEIKIGKSQSQEFREMQLGISFPHFQNMHQELKEKYDKLLEFTKEVSIDIVHSEFMADKVRERAIKLLKEIGE